MLQSVTALSLLLLSVVSCQPQGFTADLYSYGTDVGDASRTTGDDTFDMVGTLSTPYILYGTGYTTVFAGTNGQVSFGAGATAFSPGFPTMPPMVTAYWRDLNPGVVGTIYRRIINSGTAEDDAELADLANRLRATAIIVVPCFAPSSAAVVTYEGITRFQGNANEVNTFQVILMTDGVTSYSVFLYNTMDPANNPGIVGFTDGTRSHTVPGGEGSTDLHSASENLPMASNVEISGVLVFRTQEPTAILPGFPMAIQLQTGLLLEFRDNADELPAMDDAEPMCYELSSPFRFLGESYNDICVDPNGLISFGGVFPRSCCPRDFPLRKDPPPLLMPFWSDINAQLGGEIWSRLNNSADQIAEVTCRLRTLLGTPASFAPTNVLLATWYQVAEYQTMTTDRNTFQVVLASDGEQSFAIAVYESIEWPGNAQLGLSSGDRYELFGEISGNNTALLGLTGIQYPVRIDLALPPPVVPSPPSPTDGPEVEEGCDPFEVRRDNIRFESRVMNGREIYFQVSPVEVCIDGEFYTICDREWDDELANISCNAINDYSRRVGTALFSSEGGRTVSPIFPGYISCEEDATEFSQCNFTRDDNFMTCDPITNTAGMLCRDEPFPCSEPQLRLSDETYSRDSQTGYEIISGRVEICLNGSWSAICDNGWGLEEARVACNLLGYRTEEFLPSPMSGFGPYVGRVDVDSVVCTGLETDPRDCQNVVPPTDPACIAPSPDPGRLAGVTCARIRRTCSSPGVDSIQETNVSPFNGGQTITSRITLCNEDLGQYWPLCATGFDDEDATVFCRGFFGSSYTGTSMDPGFTYTTQNYIRQQLNCNSSIHNDLTECPDRELPPSLQCTVATAVCRAECSYDGALRIVGSNPYSGRVEVCEDGQWVSICDDEWDDHEADLVCIQEEFRGGERGEPSTAGPRIAYSNVTCGENETYFNLQFTCDASNETCQSGLRAAVNCQPSSLDIDVYPVGETELGSETFRMHCGAYQFPWNATLDSFEWRQNGDLLSSDDNRLIIELTNGYDDGRGAFAYNSSMQFFPLSPRDAGLYFCDATINVTYPDGPDNTTYSNFNRSMGYMLRLNVPGPVAWIRSEGLPYNGQQLNLSCYANFTEGTPEEAIMITWWANGERVIEDYPRLQISDIYQLNEETYVRNLTYNPLMLSDTSDLNCTATVNSTFLYSERAAVPYDLFVQVPGGGPPVISDQPRGGSYLVDDEVILECRASGDDLNYSWFFENNLIANETSYRLNISSVRIEDRGYYYCQASNSLGTDTSERALVRLRDVRVYYIELDLSNKYPPSLQNLASYLQEQDCLYRDRSVVFERVIIPPNTTESLVVVLSAVRGEWPELMYLRDQLDAVAQEIGHGVEAIRRIDVCPVDSEDNYDWPERELGEVAMLSCRCGTVDTSLLGYEAARVCSGNYSTLMAVRWEDPALVECARLRQDTCDATNGGASGVLDYTRAELDPVDIAVVASFLNELVDSDQLDAEGENLLAIIDQILKQDPADILESHEETKSSAFYLNSLGRFADRVELGTENNRTFDLTEFGLHIVEQEASDYNGITFSAIADPNDPDSSITVLADIFNDPVDERAAATLTLPPSLVRDLELVGSLLDLDVVIRYNFAAQLNPFFFQLRNNSRPQAEFEGLEIGGIFISAALRGIEVENLPENITLRFTKTEAAQRRGRARCMFWDQGLDNGFGGLSERGCYVTEDEDTYVECACDHLTFFTIVTEVSTEVPFESELTIFNYVMLGLAIIILLVTILLTLFYEGLSKSYRFGPLFFTSLWLMFLYMIFIISRSVDQFPNNDTSQIVLGAFTHLFINLYLWWTVSNALLMLVMANKIRSGRFKLVYNVCCFFINLFLALLFTGVAMVGYRTYFCNFFCRPYEEPLWYDLVIGTGIIYVIKFILYFITLFYICISKSAIKSVVDNVVASMFLSLVFLAYMILGLAGSSTELYGSVTGSGLLFAFSALIFIHAFLTLLLHPIDGARVTDDENTPDSLSGDSKKNDKVPSKGGDEEVGAVHNPLHGHTAAPETTEMRYIQPQPPPPPVTGEAPATSTFEGKKDVGSQ